MVTALLRIGMIGAVSNGSTPRPPSWDAPDVGRCAGATSTGVRFRSAPMGRNDRGEAVMTRHVDGSAVRRTRLVPRRTGSIAERLAYLFDVVHASGTRGYTAAEVARGVRAAGGSISDVYINKLLNGQRGEPSLRYLRMLAGFFGVPLTFFLDDDPGPIDGPGLDLQIRLRSPQVQAMLAAARRLPEPAQSALGDIVTSLLRAEVREIGRASCRESGEV